MRRERRFPQVIGLALVGALLGCQGSRRNAEVATGEVPSPAAEGEILATVNGQPITKLDVEYWLAKNTRGRVTEGTPEQVRNVLEAIISQELIRQQAVALGLDKTPEFRQKLRSKQAEMDSFLRTALRREFYAHKTREVGTLSDAEVRRFFDEHADKIQTRYHIYQILRSSEEKIEDAARQLANGAPFEEVAGLTTTDLPDSARRQWDVGELNWIQMPEPWRKVVDGLAVGETSGIIRSGEGRAFWIIKLVGQTRDPSESFEQVKAALATALKRDKIEGMRATIDHQLREGATIVYRQPPPTKTASRE